MIYVAGAKCLGLVVGGWWVVKTLMNALLTNRYDQTWTGRNADDLVRFYKMKKL